MISKSILFALFATIAIVSATAPQAAPAPTFTLAQITSAFSQALVQLAVSGPTPTTLATTTVAPTTLAATTTTTTLAPNTTTVVPVTTTAAPIVPKKGKGKGLVKPKKIKVTAAPRIIVKLASNEGSASSAL